MNREEILIFGGFTEEEVEAIKEAARIWAERVRIAIEEAVAAFSKTGVPWRKYNWDAKLIWV